MNALKGYSLMGILVFALILASCGQATPSAVATPKPVFPSPPHTLQMTPVTETPIEALPIFTFMKNVQVTPADGFKIGGFTRIIHIPSRNTLAVVFGTKLEAPIGECTDTAHAYREFNLDMEPSGDFGVINCESGDSTGLMVDDFFYDVSMHNTSGQEGWWIMKFDTRTWTPVVETFFPVDSPYEGSGDMTAVFIGARIDISSGYTSYGGPPSPDEGAGTHHEFFSPDLVFEEKMILEDYPHIGGGSIIFMDGKYQMVTATAFTGDLIVMQYDEMWNYLGMKPLIEQAHWSTGLAFDGSRYYIAYLDTRQHTEGGFFPFYPNVHLAAFDREWNLLDDVAVTDYTTTDGQFTGRPWVLLHGNKLYVGYDDVPLPEDLTKIQAFVSMYEIRSP